MDDDTSENEEDERWNDYDDIKEHSPSKVTEGRRALGCAGRKHLFNARGRTLSERQLVVPLFLVHKKSRISCEKKAPSHSCE